MKIIDEKGKFFGKINLIDLLALLVLVAALVFVAVKFTTPAEDSAIGPTTKLTYVATVNGVLPDIYDELMRQMDQCGGTDQLMANGEMVDAYITKVEAKPHLNYTTKDDGTIVISEDTGDNMRYDVSFTVEAQVDSAVTNKVGTQEVRVGKSHILKTTHFEFSYSTITYCQWG